MIGTDGPFADDSFDHEQFAAECETLQAESELRHRDFLCGRISWDEFVTQHYCLVARYERLQAWLFSSRDAFERRQRASDAQEPAS